MENQIDYLEGENAKLKNKVDELEEENRKLKADSYNELQRLWLENYELREENKKLKSDLWTVIDERDNAFKKIKQLEKELEEWKKNKDYYLLKYEELEEKVETLELWLDMKEKLNEEYRKQLGKLVMNNPS